MTKPRARKLTPAEAWAIAKHVRCPTCDATPFMSCLVRGRNGLHPKRTALALNAQRVREDAERARALELAAAPPSERRTRHVGERARRHPTGAKREAPIQVKVTTEERDAVHKLAARFSWTASRYLRELVRRDQLGAVKWDAPPLDR